MSKATFFLANEKTVRGDYSLDPGWGEYWRARVAEGHAFGSHTWDHGSFRGDLEGGRVRYVRGGKTSILDADGVCAELKRVDTRFRELTGRSLDPVWSAPGGHTDAEHARSGEALRLRARPLGGRPGSSATSCRRTSTRTSSSSQRALKNLRDGDVMMMHLGIQSRQEPLAPMLDPLLAGLKSRGFCFATLAKGPP